MSDSVHDPVPPSPVEPACRQRLAQAAQERAARLADGQDDQYDSLKVQP